MKLLISIALLLSSITISATANEHHVDSVLLDENILLAVPTRGPRAVPTRGPRAVPTRGPRG